MLRSECSIPTRAGERYARQLCGHAERMGARASWTPPIGVVQFPQGGVCTLTAGADTLELVAEASTAEELGTIQAIVRADLERFGHRDGMQVQWAGDHGTPPPAPHGMPGAHMPGHHRQD